MTQLTGAQMLAGIESAIIPPTSYGNNSQGISLNNAEPIEQAMLMGSDLESGWNTDASGGGASGLYQFQVPADWGLTVAQTGDPSAASKAILGSYATAFNDLNAQTGFGLQGYYRHPEAYTEATILAAEKPENWQQEYASLVSYIKGRQGGQFPTNYGMSSSTNVVPAFNAAAAVLAGTTNQTNTGKAPLGSIGPDPGNNASDIDPGGVTPVAPGFTFGGLKNFFLGTIPWEKIGLTVLGAVFIIVGLAITFRGRPNPIQLRQPQLT